MKRILINSSYGDELRVALVDGAKLYDLDTESPDRVLLKGSIFKATVSRIESSLDAAFVNFGSERHGFLPLKDLSSEFYRKNANGKSECTLKEGQDIIVQVTKEERGTKGAALTTQIGLAGRFLVLIPNSSRSGGISRRISGEERDQIKDALSNLDIPEDMSAIVRTNGLGRTSEELALDLSYLLALWEEISKTFDSAPSPSLIFRDDKLIVRVVKDYFKEDIEEILIDDKPTHDEALEFISAVLPDHADKVKYYDEEIPLFNRYQIESQIELAFQREISLTSGGSIVIDPTEAMTAIDVNSARSTKGKDIEDTAYKTNLEAAREVARQLRLRDVGGLVVIDFIDMMDSKHQEKVESAFRKAVYTDRARVQISNISRFGLLEVSRQRLRPSLNESYDIEHVLVRGPRSLGQSILRIIGEDSAKDNTAEIQVFVPSDVASYLLNEKRNDIMHIEKSNNIKVIIVADPYKSRPYYKVIRVKASDVKNIDSYKLVPNSPEPDTDWRDDKNINKSMKPLVSGIKPPKMPKKKKDGLVSWIKSIAGIDSEDKKTKKVVKKSNNRKPQQRRNPNRKPKQGANPKKPAQNKQNQQNKKPVNKKPNQQQKKSNDNQKNVNKKAVEQKNPVQSKPKQKTQNNKNIKNDPVSKNVSSPKASEDVKNKDLNKKVKTENKPVQKKPVKEKTEAPKIKKPLIQEIKKEAKIKKEIPTRASNDPRDKT
ncbi:MAG: Rne/Rng family ribonuclease [SAR86 cluster bacterium]|nr:Rne/Rng family ribonuclease [SAR86 cluster bacterium]MDG1948435.1 Rne/Rng family ribonuclease [SAR86 cluster bacterium]MDG2091993.1 Rne/Rng family ribonuclease [SAR86 cluster bacterium]|tara:strand:+ start:18757 stop:20898 length:2142 start_codon:yes stop_codon:yes gene_type:complete